MTTDNGPTPSPDDPVPMWAEYDHLRDAVEQYLEHEAPARGASEWRYTGEVQA